MDLTTFALIIAFSEFLIGIPLAVAPRKTGKWLLAFTKDDKISRLVGWLLVMISAPILVRHSEIGTDPQGIVVLFVWICFLKGLLYTWFPGVFEEMKKDFLKNPTLCSVGGVVAIGIGFFFLHLAALV